MIRIKIRKEIDRKKYLLFAILSFVIVLAAWLIASESGAIKEIFLPKPQNVVNYYIESIKDGSLLQNTGISIYRITLGFVYAVLLGVPIGILVGTFKKAEAFIRPLCEFVRYMPVPAFVPLIMVWVGIEESAKITVIFIGTFFQLVLMVADDALAVPDDLINAGYTLGSNTPKTIFKILIPAMMPRLMETLRVDLFGQRRTGSCKYRTWIHNLKIAAFLKDGRYFCQHYFDRSAWTDYGPYFCIFK